MAYAPAVKLIDEAGMAYGVKHVNNKPRVSSMSYLYDIAEGNVANHNEFEQLGYNSDIDAAATEDMWPTGGTYAFPGSAAGLELVSTSVEDDPDKGGDVTGTGIHAVTIYYLDASFVAKSTDVTLNGTGVVATTPTDLYRIQSMRAKTVGTGGGAAGTIVLRGLTGGATYSSIEVGQNRSRQAIWTVPALTTLYITSITVGAIGLSTTGATFAILAKYDHLAAEEKAFWITHAEIMAGIGGFFRPFEIPLRIPAGIDVKVRCTASANNTAVSCGLRGWYET
jgi:hypothetical protein